MRAHTGQDAIGDYSISGESELTKWLKQNREIFIKEEAEKTLENRGLIPIREITDKLGAAICIPAMIEDNLIGFIMLGEKASGEMYSHIDNRILKRLGTQLAVAINYKRIEAQLIKERESVGLAKNRLTVTTSMAYGLADRVRNYINPALTFFDLYPERSNKFEDKLTDTEKESIASIFLNGRKSIERTIKLANEMAAMCNAKTLSEEKYEPNIILDIVDSMAEELKTDMQGKEIRIEKGIEGNPSATYFDKNTMTKVLFNLIQNSIHAIEETKKGLVSVKVTGPILRSDKEYVRILVQDNGIGIPKENIDDIFNPFFSTKGTAGGTGLGLIMCQFMISQHEGFINILQSEIDKGTTMYFDLPVKKDPAKPVIDFKDILGQFPGRRK